MMKDNLVLIIEDQSPQRNALEVALKVRGFEAQSAGTVAESRELLNRLGDKADVVVLDMRLDDSTGFITGADLGIEFLHEKQRRGESVGSASIPEFLILSVFAEADYYRKALDLGVAAYLQKQQSNQEEVIRHVRALSLRRALNIEHDANAEKLARLAEGSKDEFDAIAMACKQVFAEGFKKLVGAPFIFLLHQRNQAFQSGSDLNLPEQSPCYEYLQALSHGQINRAEPLVLDSRLLSAPSDKDACNLYAVLDGGAFIPIYSHHHLRLSLGILKDSSGNMVDEQPEALARIISQYVRPSLTEWLFVLLSQWRELKERRRLKVLSNLSRGCIFIGQVQLDLLADAKESGEISPKSELFRNMKDLAEDLRATGETLLPEDTAGDGTRQLRVAETIADAWTAVQEQVEIFGVEPPIITTKDCFRETEVIATRVELLLAVVRIMQWMVQRKQRVPRDGRQQIFVEWAEEDENVLIAFEDRSVRLSNRWRKFLFEPFTQAASQSDWKYESDDSEEDNTDEGSSIKGRLRAGRYLPLYLAKMLVELKNGGELEDDTESMKEHVGHRFVMIFPKLTAQSSIGGQADSLSVA